MRNNNQNYSRLVGTSPARLILTGLLAITIVVVMATGIVVWYSTNVRRYEQITKAHIEEIGWAEDELTVQDPWEIKGLKPIQIKGKMMEPLIVEKNDAPTINSNQDSPCTVYKWPVPMTAGLAMETELVTKGKDHVVRCKTNLRGQLLSMPEGASFTWKLNGETIYPAQSPKYTIMEDGGLKVDHLTETDSGVYTCHYKKGQCYLSELVRTVKLKVKGHGQQ